VRETALLDERMRIASPRAHAFGRICRKKSNRRLSLDTPNTIIAP
jgi:hypothetical protein